MTYRDTRLQAAIVRGHEILVLEMLVDDGRRFWLLPGGGHEASDVDESAAIAREVREETTAAVSVERLLIEAPAHPDDATYRRYRTFLCHPIAGSEPVAGARDGIATICAVRWLHLDDEAWDVTSRKTVFSIRSFKPSVPRSLRRPKERRSRRAIAAELAALAFRKVARDSTRALSANQGMSQSIERYAT